jgi:hypothetical protein
MVGSMGRDEYAEHHAPSERGSAGYTVSVFNGAKRHIQTNYFAEALPKRKNIVTYSL